MTFMVTTASILTHFQHFLRRLGVPLSLGLSQFTSPQMWACPAIFAEKRMEQLNRIIEHLETLGSSPAKPVREKLMLKCFFSYRFADENEITALRIQEFLKLLDVEVSQEIDMSRCRISEKVLSALREPLRLYRPSYYSKRRINVDEGRN